MGDYMATYHLFTKTMFHDTVEICASKTRQVFTIESPGLSSTSDLESVEGKSLGLGVTLGPSVNGRKYHGENCGEIIPFFVAENKRVNDVVFLPLEVEVLSPYFFFLVLLGNWG